MAFPMAPFRHVNVLERCQVSPPQGSAPPTSLPLTFFDIPWLLFPHNQPLFFYKFPFSPSHFTTTILPILKRSLSLTLLHFYPLAGNLFAPPQPSEPRIVFAENNSLSLTIAESNASFSHLTSNHPKNAYEFHPLVPNLPYSSQDNHLLPLLSVQITIFPNSGISIGLAIHQVVADQRTINQFLKTWAFICRQKLHGNSSISINSLPSFDRTVIQDPNGLAKIFLDEFRSRKLLPNKPNFETSQKDLLRATFVLNVAQMESFKQAVTDSCKKTNQPLPVRLSKYVFASAFIWVCLIKSRHAIHGRRRIQKELQSPLCFGFIAGGITRLKFKVPSTYFGNCVGFGKCTAMEEDLLGEDGIVAAAKAVAETIKELDDDILGGAERWIEEYVGLLGSCIDGVMVVGSPKVDMYETDFGWGRPKKIEEISIDGKMGAFSFTESMDLKGGIEVGLVLPHSQIDAFTYLFNQGLEISLSTEATFC